MGELVTIKIDNQEVQVPKGINLIEAAKIIGIEIPHYCYHPDLPIAGNCRMCQVKVSNSPKLVIACNTFASEGLEVFTHHTNEEVKKTQEDNLEFILKNHPLDCTVCDQAGHCKLQDYYFEYSRRESRLLETKTKKKKAFPIGPHVVLDAERCILCSRCVRFCDEITKTGELTILNRGDKSEIAIHPARQLDNPLSATVIDLCPVGALTYRDWRFRSRIWFSEAVDTICLGCSTNCSVKVHHRDGDIVTIKARYNPLVNKEWLCDEGRFGFDRFIPKRRKLKSREDIGRDLQIIKEAFLKGQGKTVLLSSFLTVEEILLFHKISEKFPNLSFQSLIIERNLNEVEKVLISPDYSPNKKVFELLNFPKFDSRKAQSENLIGVGITTFEANLVGLKPESFEILVSAYAELAGDTTVFIPTKYVYEKEGKFLNSSGVLQDLNPIFPTNNWLSEFQIFFELFSDKIETLDLNQFSNLIQHAEV